MELAQSGYPRPDDKDEKGERKYTTYEDMLPSYTFALGGTDAIKKVIDFLNSQDATIRSIQKKLEGKSDYAI